MAVSNQRILYIKRSSVSAKSNYCKITHESLAKAMKDLDGSALKLWLYLTGNADGYKLELSSKHFCEWANVDRSSYTRAWKKLLELGYIIQSNKANNIFFFQEEREEEDVVFATVDDKQYQEEYEKFCSEMIKHGMNERG